MRRPALRSRVRRLMIVVAVAAVGLFLLRAVGGGAHEIIIRQYSRDWRPWNRGHAVRVRLDVDRLRACGLSEAGVSRALTPTRMVDPEEPPPPPGVVFVTRYVKPDRWENIVLKADAEGEVVRLKDVARVEVAW